jgi:FkbM family methyltransferase
MSSRYFILTKENNKKVDDNTNNQIIYLNDKIHHILPQTNIQYYCENGLFESALIEWSSQFCKKEKVFLDIGAHSGTYSLSLAHNCREVYSFEPQKSTYYALCGGVALSNIQNITCLNFGLGSPEQVGKRTLKIVSSDGGGSSLHANNQRVLREEQIEVKTLDSFEINEIGFIKMDVEDNELYVLQGAIETLKRSNYPPILFESNNKNDELFCFINNLGYKIIEITGVSNMFLASIQ